MPMTTNATKKAQDAVADLEAKWKSASARGLVVWGVGTNEAYRQLEAAVKASALKDENQAAMVERVTALGKAVASLAKVLHVI